MSKYPRSRVTAFIDASENGLQPGDREPMIVTLVKS